MLILKAYWHVVAIIKIIIYKLLFGRRLCFPLSSTFRERFNLTLKDGTINIGKHVFFNHDCSLSCNGSSITIGDGTLFGECVKIYDHNHRYNDTSLHIKQQGFDSAPIRIGEHCWIASNVVILKGVTIGDNSVIGAGCIVYKDVPPNSVVINKQDIVIKARIPNN